MSTPSGSWPGGSSSDDEGHPTGSSAAGSGGQADGPGGTGGPQHGAGGWEQQPGWDQPYGSGQQPGGQPQGGGQQYGGAQPYGSSQQGGGAAGPAPQPYGQYPQQYYNAPTAYGAGQPPQQQRSNGFGVTALVLGIVSILAAFVFGVPGIVLGIAAIVFAVLNFRRVKAGRADNRGMSVAGLVTGIIGILLGIVMLFVYIAVFSTVGNCVTQYQDSGDRAQYNQCVENGFS